MDMSPRLPTKVLFLCVAFPAISETFIFDQMVSLRSAGVPLQIVSMWRETGGRIQETVLSWKLLDCARFCLARRGQREQAVRLMGALWRLATSRPHALAGLLALKRRGRTWKDIAWLALFGAQLLEPTEPGTTVANFGMIGRLAVDLRRLGFIDGPLITYFHGVDVTELPGRNGPDYYRELFQEGERFLIASPHFRDQLLRIGCPPGQITYLPVGIDVSAFPLRDAGSGRHAFPFRIVTVARLTEKKGHRYILDAVAALARHRAVVYDVVGDGTLMPMLREQVRALNIESQVHFHGALTRDEMVAILRQADVFVQASITTDAGDQEAIPVSIKEAMATGVPVVSTWHGGIPYLIVDDENGLLTPERDARAIENQIGRLIDDPRLGKRLARNARTTIERKWDNAFLLSTFIEVVQHA